ncbi:MAG: RNA polymerase sigma factor [Planctomycetota bacterium]
MIPPPDDAAQDLALVRAARAGGQRAVQALAERLQCVPRILCAQNARLGRVLGEHDLADAVQDTLLVVLRKLDDFTGAGAFEAWLHRICAYELMNAVRRRRRLPAVFDPDDQPIVDDAAAAEWRRLAARETLDEALARIGGAEAETLRLRHYDGQSFEEIARRLGASVTAVKARYYRALSRLEQIVHSARARELAEEEGHGHA